MQKLKKLLNDRKEMLELVRYVIAGGVTTLLSLAIKYGCYILLSQDHTIDGANTAQVMTGTLISWVIAVVFAFWINRWMVFRVQGGTRHSKIREFLQFAGARLVSWAVIEEGIAVLIKLAGISNTVNALIVMVLVTVFNYVVSKFWIFKPKPDAGDAPSSDANPDDTAAPDFQASQATNGERR
ncbi:MAG: GtrA family protein [Eubacteriales bacterium]|nr:GtrA family protein [Eubacteriales bacterium]